MFASQKCVLRIKLSNICLGNSMQEQQAQTLYVLCKVIPLPSVELFSSCLSILQLGKDAGAH